VKSRLSIRLFIYDLRLIPFEAPISDRSHPVSFIGNLGMKLNWLIINFRQLVASHVIPEKL